MLELDWITFVVIVIVALIAGAALNRLWAKSQGDDTTGLKRQLDDLKRQHQNYQVSVTEHFNRTTQLIDGLNKSYNDIREHLNQGADQLVAPEYRLESARMNENDLEELAPARALEDEGLQMPRDYAPKNRDEEGTLSETYGLRKEQFFEDDPENTDAQPKKPQ
ncbi:MAG: Z-ring associated ZapG family protein [Saccharospirillum sp.]